ncbi:LPS assembly lipoprotein LptE [Roseovarius sp.]|uniref:LPS assembly lipoprotein LptE n=1 Tax=Roseovarius sp. TaxID=1486281 RepID=UPI0025F5BD3D|nr:LPS assembly lipoprotein LptE [Roseovarius sp.]
MLSFNRRHLLLLGAAALGACGFTPAYAPNGAGNVLQGQIEIDAPNTRAGYLLTRVLEDRFGRSTGARYGLSHATGIREDSIAISASNVATRFNLIGSVTYALRDLETGAVVTSGKVDSFTSYSASGSPVATQTAKRDAEARLMNILGEQISTRLLAAAPALSQ